VPKGKKFTENLIAPAVLPKHGTPFSPRPAQNSIDSCSRDWPSCGEPGKLASSTYTAADRCHLLPEDIGRQTSRIPVMYIQQCFGEHVGTVTVNYGTT
jgi:hypothetical protein